MLQVVLLALALFQNPVPALPTDSLSWDYADADILSGGVDHFAIALDSAAPVNVTVAAVKVTGQQSYLWKLPAMAIGAHTVTVEACAGSSCSTPASLPFTLIVQPKPVSQLRLSHGG